MGSEPVTPLTEGAGVPHLRLPLYRQHGDTDVAADNPLFLLIVINPQPQRKENEAS